MEKDIVSRVGGGGGVRGYFTCFGVIWVMKLGHIRVFEVNSFTVSLAYFLKRFNNVTLEIIVMLFFIIFNR